MMNRDPVCGMTGVFERHGHWFCSERCAREFARRTAPGSAPAQAAGCRVGTRNGWRDPWVWVPASSLLISLLGWWWPIALPMSARYVGYLRTMGAPLLLGLVVGGAIDHFVPKDYIVNLLSGPRKRVIARATLLGVLASSCSHGCLALSLELFRKGASVPAVVSFLLASPWASMSLTFMLVSFFGLRGGVIVISAMAIAFLTGLLFQRLAHRGWIETNPHAQPVDHTLDVWDDLRARWRRYPWRASQLAADARGVVAGMRPLGRMVLGWVQLGLVLSAVLGTWVPHGVFVHALGPSIGGLLLTLLAATIMEVCSEGTAPVAFELYRHTGALGNAFAFLMGGVITDYTELGAVWKTIGRRTAGWLVIVTLPMVLGMGWILNQWHRP